MSDRLDCVIVGAGQAGLATSRELRRQGVDHVMLDRGRVGDSWRGRWESFCLVSPNWSILLPEGEYEGDDPDGFLVRDEMVSHLVHYAERIDAPVREQVEVSSLRPPSHGRGFVLDTSEGPLEARTVVAATGAYQHPHRPAAAAGLPDGLPQLDVAAYSSPTALPAGPVLVVGSGQSGAQIAEELNDAGRTVFLACGRAPWCPRRIGGRDLFWWALETGFADQPVSALPTPVARLEANLLASGRHGGRDLHLRTLQGSGVNLVGHFLGCEGRHARFAADLGESLAWGDERYRRYRGLVDKLAAERGMDLPPPLGPGPVRRRGARVGGPHRLRRGGVRWRLPPGLRVVGRLSRRLRRARLPAPGQRSQHGRARPLFRRRPLPAHAQVGASRGSGRGRSGGGRRAQRSDRALRPTAGSSPTAA